MIVYFLFAGADKCRRVGMADEADSKSVVGNHVWVQVPLPALFIKREINENIDFSFFFAFWGFFLLKEDKQMIAASNAELQYLLRAATKYAFS